MQEPYEPKEGTDQKLIKELVDALQEKPARDGNQALLSNGISIKTYTLENGLLTLNLSGEYGELARPQEVLVRAGLVRTFVQVPERPAMRTERCVIRSARMQLHCLMVWQKTERE